MNILSGSGLSGSLLDNSLSFITDMAGEMQHYHYCYKVVISLDNPFDCLIDGQSIKGVRGFIVNQTVPHSCTAAYVNVLVNFIEADGLWGSRLRAMLDGRAWLDLATLLTPRQMAQVLPADYQTLSSQKLAPYVSVLLDLLFSGGDRAHRSIVDPRIQVSVQYINEHLNEKLDLEIIADLISLSPERAGHIFAMEMGIPFSQYILWKRIRSTLSMVIRDENTLTQASIRSGFKDQIHFNKVFKRIFGFPPGGLISRARVLL